MSYILLLCTVLLALFSLHKDWTNYKHPWVQKAVFVLILIVGAAQGVKLSLDNRAAQIAKANAENDINTLKSEVAGLQGQVKSANEAQTQNTKDFLENFNRLHVRIGELQTKVTTEELRKQLASVQNDLQKTQKALAPAPKAKLTFSFVPFFNPPSALKTVERAATETTLVADADNTVHIQYTVLNATDVSAEDGEITLTICDACTFAKEPEHFTKLQVNGPTSRFATFQRLLPHTNFDTASVDVVVPRTLTNLTVGISFRCRTCVLDTGLSSGIVHIARPFVRPLINLPDKKQQPNKKK